MQLGTVGGAVVGHQPLDPDALGRVEAQRPPQKADAGCGLLVGEQLHVGEPGRVVDADVHELPAGAAGAPAWTALAGGAVARALAPDPPELLDVDVQELPGPLALVAIRRLGRLEARELAEPDAGQDPLHRGERHPERQRDLLTSEPHAAQRRDRRDAVLWRRPGLAARRRAAIDQPDLALGAVAIDPLARSALAHLGGLGRLAERPPLPNYAPGEPQALLRCEGGVTVELHPVTSLGLGGFDTPSLQGGPDEQRGQVLHLDRPYGF